MRLAIAAALAVGLFLVAMLWPQPACRSVTYYAFGNEVTVGVCE